MFWIFCKKRRVPEEIVVSVTSEEQIAADPEVFKVKVICCYHVEKVLLRSHYISPQCDCCYFYDRETQALTFNLVKGTKIAAGTIFNIAWEQEPNIQTFACELITVT